ncbi:MAG: hypothetical protein V1660_01860 [archaeon]
MLPSTELMPIFVFIFVYVLVYALIGKTKILGENKFIHSLLSLAIAIIFIVAPNAREYTLTVTPWIIVFLIAVFFMLILIGFVRGNIEEVVKNPVVSFGLIAVLLLIFLISGVQVFGSAISHFFNLGTTSEIKSFLTNPSVLGVIVLFAIGGVISWFANK